MTEAPKSPLTPAQRDVLLAVATKALPSGMQSWSVTTDLLAVLTVDVMLPALLDQLAAWQAVEVQADEVVIEDDRQP